MVGTNKAAVGSAVSANQDYKRAQIIEAARAVLAHDGLSGCTARSVAAASPLTKSAIHYYFRDIDEIIDLAIAAHLDTMLVSLRTLAAQHRDPLERLRAIVHAYLDTFAEKPHAAFLWFEYWIASARRGRTAEVESMLAGIERLMVELLTDLPVGQPQPVARTLLSWLLGSVVQQQARPQPRPQLHDEIDTILRRLLTTSPRG